MVGAWHWSQRPDPLESAFQVWCVYSVSLLSHILVNSMSEINNVRITECLIGLALFLLHGVYMKRICSPSAMCWCKPSPHNTWDTTDQSESAVAMNVLLEGLISGSGYISRTVRAMNSGDGLAYYTRPSYYVHIVRIPYRSFVQESPNVHSFIWTWCLNWGTQYS